MFHPLFELSGRVALVSGAAQNMGRAAAIALAEAGADLLITDINESGLLDTADVIRQLGRKVVPAVYDVWNEAQIRAMYQQVDREFGQIDIVANIPGANILGHPEEITLEHFTKVINATLVSKFVSCQEAGRRMLASGKGSIINMSSIGGVRALGRGNFAYSVGQAGVIQMTRELSTEWADRGVRVNAIAPAQITNPGFDVRMDNTPGLRERFLRGIPAGRLGVPDDIKGLVIFLASDASSFITGSVFGMDGGNLAMGANGTIGRREA
ncbi:MAG: SDR family oxidoreductase [Caldilineae bacterium]|nr:SDR family oxidoreductase [Caldilineae bacterium]